jgi:hypothetical protein
MVKHWVLIKCFLFPGRNPFLDNVLSEWMWKGLGSVLRGKEECGSTGARVSVWDTHNAISQSLWAACPERLNAQDQGLWRIWCLWWGYKNLELDLSECHICLQSAQLNIVLMNLPGSQALTVQAQVRRLCLLLLRLWPPWCPSGPCPALCSLERARLMTEQLKLWLLIHASTCWVVFEKPWSSTTMWTLTRCSVEGGAENDSCTKIVHFVKPLTY